MQQTRVAVDAMGGDQAPEAPVAGAVRAWRETQIPVILVGDEARIRSELERIGASSLIDAGIEIRHAPEVVAMDEKPAQAARKKKHSSIRIALDLVKSGEASAMVSAGNSGAVMATALVALGRIRGVLRPAIVNSSPNIKRRTVLLDIGANTEVDPVILAQWAYMGAAYAHSIENCEQPKVGILSNGEEDSKGTDLTRSANALLKQAKGINYAGYAEGRDVAGGDFDVVVTDGFTGNVVLKTLEGSGKFVSHLLRQEYEKGLVRKLGYLLSKGVFATLRKVSDYREYGGAPLLGIDGVVIIAHGGSDDLAIMRAVAQGKRHHEVGLNQIIANIVTEHAELFKRAQVAPAATDAGQAVAS